jgi:hypothetical protein
MVFSNVTTAEVQHKCLNSDTCHSFEQSLTPAAESEVRSRTILAQGKAPLRSFRWLGPHHMVSEGLQYRVLPHVTLASSLHESRPAMSTVFTTEEPSLTDPCPR